MAKMGKVPVEFKVRYSECDVTGHAFNANFFIWMQEAASEFFRASGADLKKLAFDNHTFMAVHQSCDYKRPVSFEDIIEVRPVMEDVRDSSVHIRYDIYKGDDLAAVGRTVHSYLDLRAQKKATITDELRENFEKMKG